MPSRPVIYRNRTNPAIPILHQGWKEPMHMIERRELQKVSTVENFQAATGIGNTIMQKRRAKLVCDA